jgi:hypothetical protein
VTKWWLIVVLAASCLVVYAAKAHDWYPPECCSGRDCAPVDSTDLVEIDNGCWRQLSTGLKFCGTQVRPSQDKHWHVCHNASGSIPYCVFIQNGF